MPDELPFIWKQVGIMALGGQTYDLHWRLQNSTHSDTESYACTSTLDDNQPHGPYTSSQVLLLFTNGTGQNTCITVIVRMC